MAADASPAQRVQTWTRQMFNDYLRASGLTVFRYTINNYGFIFLKICAAILWAISGGIYAATGLRPIYWGAIAVMLALAGVFLMGLVVYWTWMARGSLLAFTDDHLYVAGPKNVERIPWRLLSTHNTGLADANQDTPLGVLHMQLAGRQVTLRLFNPYIWLEDYPTFLVELLTQIKRNTLPTSAPPAADADDDADDADAVQDASNHAASGPISG
jgi:hypothetical protein